MIVALLNQKGGTGKTTLAVHLAGELALQGRRVLLVDADPQASALDWAETRSRGGHPRLFGAIGLPRETLHREIPDLARSVDDVVIDGPPRVTALVRSAMLACDLVLVPVQPSAYDVWASQAVLELLAEAQVYKPDLKALFVVNRQVVRSVIAREVRSTLGRLNISALRGGLAQRVIFAETAGSGRLVREIDAQGAAAREIAGVTQELLGWAS